MFLLVTKILPQESDFINKKGVVLEIKSHRKKEVKTVKFFKCKWRLFKFDNPKVAEKLSCEFLERINEIICGGKINEKTDINDYVLYVYDFII
ncbi:hypothetical protein M2092_002293 [Fusobacterium sp. PH5-44]|uniref:hypothetical protein n=1 Tax=Fusobacterium sp. PH5-29 TaxID=1742400 RepID=UPI003D201B53